MIASPNPARHEALVSVLRGGRMRLAGRASSHPPFIAKARAAVMPAGLTGWRGFLRSFMQRSWDSTGQAVCACCSDQHHRHDLDHWSHGTGGQKAGRPGVTRLPRKGGRLGPSRHPSPHQLPQGWPACGNGACLQYSVSENILGSVEDVVHVRTLPSEGCMLPPRAVC